MGGGPHSRRKPSAGREAPGHLQEGPQGGAGPHAGAPTPAQTRPTQAPAPQPRTMPRLSVAMRRATQCMRGVVVCFYCKIESVNNESGVAWYSPVLCSRQRTGHCSRHEKTELSPEHKGQGNDRTCEETLEVSSRSTNQDAMLWGELLQAVLIRPHRSSWPRGPTTPDVQ